MVSLQSKSELNLSNASQRDEDDDVDEERDCESQDRNDSLKEHDLIDPTLQRRRRNVERYR